MVQLIQSILCVLHIDVRAPQSFTYHLRKDIMLSCLLGMMDLPTEEAWGFLAIIMTTLNRNLLAQANQCLINSAS